MKIKLMGISDKQNVTTKLAVVWSFGGQSTVPPHSPCGNSNSSSKDVHVIVPFAYLLSPYSKFEWAENVVVYACTKKLSDKQICCTTK